MRAVIVVSTTYRRPVKLRQVIGYLRLQKGPEDRIHVVGNTEDSAFLKEDFGDGVSTIFNGERWSLPQSLNRAFEVMDNYDFCCLYHDDLVILDTGWVDRCVSFAKENYRTFGSIGVIEHSNSKPKPHSANVSEANWADGAFFMPVKVMRKIGRFDEQFTEDCETEDYARRLQKAGLKSYLLHVAYDHDQTPFGQKADMSEVMRSRVRMRIKYGMELRVKG